MKTRNTSNWYVKTLQFSCDLAYLLSRSLSEAGRRRLRPLPPPAPRYAPNTYVRFYVSFPAFFLWIVTPLYVDF